MNCKTSQSVFFSPTKTTLRIVDTIAEGMGLEKVSRLDLTFPQEDAPSDDAGDVAILGVPVYAGRVANLAVERLRQHAQGNGRPAVLVVVFGNRAFEDALLELRDLAVELGFVPVAAAAFIGEHSYSTPELPVAPGSPNEDHLQKARAFGSRVREKLQGIGLPSAEPELNVPGNFPYRDGITAGGISPKTDEALCTLCGECARMCPSQVVSVTDQAVETDSEGCIRCSACLKGCPTSARYWDVPRILEVRKFLHANHAGLKEPEIFL